MRLEYQTVRTFCNMERDEMTNRTVENLVLDLLEWLSSGPRPYDEVLDAWRTSCPQLPVWEAALDRELVARCFLPDGGRGVAISDRGRATVAAQLHGASAEALRARDHGVGGGYGA